MLRKIHRTNFFHCRPLAPVFYCNHHNHHHQPINVPIAGAQAFLMDYPQRERAITHYAGPVWIGANDCKCRRHERLNMPS
jgi:hypothetical protein